MAVRLAPVILSFVALGAHFLRRGELAVTIIFILLPFVLYVPQRWAMRMVQAVLGFGVLVWLNTAMEMRATRMLEGRPAGRAMAIMGAVALLTLISALLLESKTIKAHYAAESGSAPPGASGGAAEGGPAERDSGAVKPE